MGNQLKALLKFANIYTALAQDQFSERMLTDRSDWNKIQNWVNEISNSNVERLTHSGMERKYALEILQKILSDWPRRVQLTRDEYQSMLFDAQQHYVVRDPILPSTREFNEVVSRHIVVT